MTYASPVNRDVSLSDVVDHLLDRGVVLSGDVALTLAGVDLVYLKLHLMLASAETVRQKLALADGQEVTAGWLPWNTAEASHAAEAEGGAQMGQKPSTGGIVAKGGAMAQQVGQEAGRILPSTERPDSALAQLVLTVMELLRRMMERQALRRVEGRSLAPEVEERLGLALQSLEEKMKELREVFGLEEGDINIDLGPLGRLL